MNTKNATFNADDAISFENGGNTPEQEAMFLQKAINSGQGWQMQGSYGRAMMAGLEAGDAMLGLIARNDAYGNRVPARGEVQDGSKGSRALVVSTHGEKWAQMLETLDEAQPTPSAAKSLKP